ncbi:MAG: methyltransferase domain-containing protein [Chloroflexota bacterium]|nr:methyltransferase domain-containing protein [Chloroflexota bacterium]
MSDAYGALALFYDALGMSNFALRATPAVLQFAQQNDWLGRRIVDLGCGTGGSVRWLASQGYNITAIDTSPAMLDTARRSIDSRGVALQWIEGDARAVEPIQGSDLVLAIDVLNEMSSVRELENTFTSIARGLEADKWLIFDLHTLQGLAADHGSTRLLRADDDITAIISSVYDHERQTLQESYTLFHAEANNWTRYSAARTLRGFPVQLIIALLARTGFEVVALTTTNFEAVQPVNPSAARLFCFARRVS